MKKQLIFTKTGKGLRALQQGEPMLGQPECEILALVNGSFTLEDLKMRLPSIPDKVFNKTIKALENDGYVLCVLGLLELDTERGVKEWADAVHAAQSLSQAGYYVHPIESPKCEGPQQILIVDDEKAIGDVVSAILRDAGYDVEWVENPVGVVGKMLSMPCLSLVLLDVVMPQDNGFNVLRQIRIEPKLRRLPVVMLTAHATPEYVAEGLREGADGYILKPFHPEKLLKYLQDTLKVRSGNGVPA